ncbi:hypothetical protein R6Q59_029391 [Mikania micrantha]
MEEVSSNTGALGMTDLPDMLHGGDYSEGNALPQSQRKRQFAEPCLGRRRHWSFRKVSSLKYLKKKELSAFVDRLGNNMYLPGMEFIQALRENKGKLKQWSLPQGCIPSLESLHVLI